MWAVGRASLRARGIIWDDLKAIPTRASGRLASQEVRERLTWQDEASSKLSTLETAVRCDNGRAHASDGAGGVGPEVTGVDVRTLVKSNAELERWLREHTWFEDALVVALSPDPTTGSAPDSIRLVMGDLVSTSHVAGTEQRIQDYALTATAIRRSTLGPGLEFAPGNCGEGIEVVETDDGVAFRIDVPGVLEIACGSLLIEPLGVRSERVQPWISDREFGATIPGVPVPSPQQWVAWFRETGREVCWRMYGGEAREHPADRGEYEGWYLQEPAKVGETSGGIFFFVCRVRDGALILQWQRGETSNEVWRAAQRVLALLEPARVWCGNCEFTGAEWSLFVEDGSLPAQLADMQAGR